MKNTKLGNIGTIRLSSNKPVRIIFNDKNIKRAEENAKGDPIMFKILLEHYRGARGVHARSYFISGSTITLYGEV